MTDISGYKWSNAEPTCAHAFLLPSVLATLDGLRVPGKRIFDLGCGNGSVAHVLSRHGWDVTGVDPSEEGIGLANSRYPDLRLSKGSAYDDLAAQYGTFPVVLSLEVVEHVYDPRKYASTIFALLQPGGIAIISTPYHGYLKNLALAVTGRMDEHFTALWDHGHIKFWSIKTLGSLLREAGLVVSRTERVGRIPALAKSMIMIANRPA